MLYLYAFITIRKSLLVGIRSKLALRFVYVFMTKETIEKIT